MLTAFVYVLVPMPYLFFGGGAGGSNLASSWQDAGKFLVGFSAVAAVAIPAILYHAQVRASIELGARGRVGWEPFFVTRSDAEEVCVLCTAA
jgi:hypothetical protein